MTLYVISLCNIMEFLSSEGQKSRSKGQRPESVLCVVITSDRKYGLQKLGPITYHLTSDVKSALVPRVCQRKFCSLLRLRCEELKNA